MRFARSSEGDDLLLLQPLVDAELVADVAALEHEELLVELLLELALPLEGQVRGADHEDPLGETAQLELAHEKARHDGLAGPGVVGEQEPHRGQFEEVLVDGLELVREGVHAGDRETEIRVELIGDAQGMGLEAETKEPSVAVVGEGGVGDLQIREVVRGQGDAAKPFRPQADEASLPSVGAVRANGLDPDRLVEQRAGENLSLAQGGVGAQRSMNRTGFPGDHLV